MRKILPVILVITFLAQSAVQAQTPVIKVQQYTILIDRTITHRTEDQCYTFEYTGGTTPGSCYTSPPAPNAVPNTDKTGWCLLQDNTCGCGPNFPGNPDKITLKLYKQGDVLMPTGIPDIVIGNMPKGTSQTYYDTIRWVQAQFDLLRVESEIDYHDVDQWQWYFTGNGGTFSTDCKIQKAPYSIYPSGDYFDFTGGTGTPAPGKRYNMTMRVRVLPNLEPSFTLPSHDKVRIIQTESIGFVPVWQYQDTTSSAWHDISSSFTSSNGNVLDISGVDIFGSSYVDYLHSTIKFRVRNSANTVQSTPVAFTLRLSSPHITGVTPTNLNCFEKNEGSMKIQFDRALIAGEKLNILIRDTLSQTNYSALNLDALAGDNSYTWPNELRAGVYHVTLLGKYAKGIVNDLYVDTRVDTVTQYTALNSVNFEDGFNTPSVADFDSWTDYTSYAQATYTGSLSHLAFLTLTQPTKILFAAKVDTNVICKGAPAGVITLAAGGGKHNFKYSLKHQDSTSWSSWVNFDNNNIGTVFWPTPFFFTSEGTTTKVRNLHGVPPVTDTLSVPSLPE